MYQFKKPITIGECLLLYKSGFAIPCRSGKPIGVIDEYGDMCVCCGATVPEGRQICLICEKNLKLLKELRKGGNEYEKYSSISN
jgi:hypothetical protein